MTETLWLAKLRISTMWPFRKTFADLWSMEARSFHFNLGVQSWVGVSQVENRRTAFQLAGTVITNEWFH